MQTGGSWAGRSTTSLIVNGADLLTGPLGLGVLRSDNDGASWSPANSGMASDEILSLASVGTSMFAGTHGYGMYRSSNNGADWDSVNNGLSNPYVSALAISGADVFAGTRGGVFRSTNNGASWNDASAGLTSKYLYSLAASSSFLLAGTDSGVFRSADKGGHWLAASSGLTGKIVSAFASHDSSLFAGGAGGVFLSTDDGVSWADESKDLLSIAYVQSLIVSGTNLFAATNDWGVWRRPLSEMVSSLEFSSGDAPAAFRLDQNYPNPFNLVTTIGYALPSRSYAKLEIFNVLGRVSPHWQTRFRRRAIMRCVSTGAVSPQGCTSTSSGLKTG